MAYNLKDIKKEFSSKGIFYTQPELAKYLKSFLPDGVKEVYDPTCGNGGLLSVFDDDVEKYGQEINEDQLKDAQEHLQNFHGFCGDTLREPAWIDRKFKYIIANTPFGIKWEPPLEDKRFENIPCMPSRGMADFAFLLHILYMLDDEGVAVCMDSCAILFRNYAEGKIRQWFLENNYIDKVVYIPEKQFVDTNIRTCLWVLRKNKKNKDIIFINKKTNEEKTVSFEEIKNNNYDLSERYYFPEKRDSELPRVNDLVQSMHNDVIGQLKAVYALTRQLSTNKVYKNFITEIQAITDEAISYCGTLGEGYDE